MVTLQLLLLSCNSAVKKRKVEVQQRALLFCTMNQQIYN